MSSLRLILLLVLALAVTGGGSTVPGALAAGPAPVRVLEVDGRIDAVLARWLGDRLDEADRDGAAAVVIQLDTPGGLVGATEDITADIRATRTPVAVWVGPSGARAASAGAFIAASSDAVLMAPGTNIGAATPVGAGGDDLDAKIVNDAAASIAALAEATGHPAAPYRAMVTEASSLTAMQALGSGVADDPAATLDQAIATLDGRTVAGAGTDAGVFRTAGAPVQVLDVPWHLELLRTLARPDLVFLLLLAGLVGLTVEAFSPGALVPGGLGLLALAGAVAGLGSLPFSWLGLALIVLGVGLLFAETQVPGLGALAVGGGVALGLGGFLLFGSGDDGVATSLWVVLPAAAAVGVGGVLAGRRVLRAQRTRPVTGGQTLVGEPAVARGVVDASGGMVGVAGEVWAARSGDGAVHPPGSALRVTRVDEENLVVIVESHPPKEE